MNLYSESIILLPTLNERENLEVLLPQIFDYLPGISVLIIDDNSKDGTSELIIELQNKYKSLFILERKTRLGYGPAILDGFRWGLDRSFRYLITMDADFSHDFRSIPHFLDALQTNDVVIGSRYVRGGEIENWHLFRRLLSRFANFYARLILGMDIHDITTGFNGYRSEVIRKLNLDSIKSNGYAFLVELKYKIKSRGLKILEYPITFYERREGNSKMSGRIIWESIWLPWKLRLRRL